MKCSDGDLLTLLHHDAPRDQDYSVGFRDPWVPAIQIIRPWSGTPACVSTNRLCAKIVGAAIYTGNRT